MAFLSRFPLSRQIAFVLLVFALWCSISTVWYVCGVRGLCAITAEAHANADPTDEAAAALPLSETQAPLAVAYERAGAAGEIFVMLLITFVMGSLLGRILASPGRPEQLPLKFALPESLPQTGLDERLGTPTHVSELTKRAAAAAESTHAKSAPRATIHLPAASSKPALASAAPTVPASPPATEKPKIRFNTSWSNPYRGNIPTQK